MSTVYGCATCHRADVRRYRLYGNFLREDDIFCNAHIPAQPDEWGWWVPLIQDEDGGVWGYTSVPEPAIRGWEALPDADPTGPHWAAGRWH